MVKKLLFLSFVVIVVSLIVYFSYIKLSPSVFVSGGKIENYLNKKITVRGTALNLKGAVVSLPDSRDDYSLCGVGFYDKNFYDNLGKTVTVTGFVRDIG